MCHNGTYISTTGVYTHTQPPYLFDNSLVPYAIIRPEHVHRLVQQRSRQLFLLDKSIDSLWLPAKCGWVDVSCVKTIGLGVWACTRKHQQHGCLVFPSDAITIHTCVLQMLGQLDISFAACSHGARRCVVWTGGYQRPTRAGVARWLLWW